MAGRVSPPPGRVRLGGLITSKKVYYKICQCSTNLQSVFSGPLGRRVREVDLFWD